MTRLLGVALPADAIASTFARLKFAFTREGDDFVVTPPSFRFDLAIEEDFVEEAARMHGYDAIPAGPGAACPAHARRSRVAAFADAH